ncbi:MAG: hypothetical protein JNJ73_09475 [Hyphomonadaceae bacterium]|nr:hypothetical protein [Hyphomonadaceae bacterium]
MSWRLFLMFMGTLACLAPLIVAPGFIRTAPMLLNVEFSSLNALLGWASVLATTLLPVVCIVSMLRGWFAWAGGPRDEALSRMLLWPAVAVFFSAALYLVGRLMQL